MPPSKFLLTVVGIPVPIVCVLDWFKARKDAGCQFFIQLCLVLVLVGLAIWLTRVRLNRKTPKPEGDQKLIFPSLCVCYSFIGFVAILFVVVDPGNRMLFVTIFGLIISSLLAISSSSFVANAMSGFLVNRAENFGDGDWVEVGEHFGKVVKKGLFHLKLQNVHNDSIIVPYTYMSGTPAKFLKKRGTVITSKVSLGYDVHHATVSQCLLRAATERAGLNEAVVHVDELGDYSISYRVTGTLTDIEKLLEVRSLLRRSILDELHENQVEIVSPAFVTQRRFDANRLTIPKVATNAKLAARKRKHEQATPTAIRTCRRQK